MILRLVIVLLRRVLGLLLTLAVFTVLGRGPRARMVLRGIRMARRVTRF